MDERTATQDGVLQALAKRIVRSAGPDLASLVAYGDGRRLMLVLEHADAAVLARLAPALGKARERHGVDPFVVTRHELGRLADVFPLRLWYVQRDHELLHGEDLVSHVPIERAHLRLRLEQLLRNRQLRLRRRLLGSWKDEHGLVAALARNGRALEVELDALTSLEDQPGSAGSLRGDPVLEELRRLRRGQAASNTPGLAVRLLDLLARAVDTADRLPDA